MRMINARAESVLEKAVVRQGRGVAALSGAGRRAGTSGRSRPTATDAKGKPRKQPFFMHRPTATSSRSPGCTSSGGTAEIADDDDPEAWLTTFTIITTDAEPGLDRIHDRQPLVLEREDWATWLDQQYVLVEQANASSVPRARRHDRAERRRAVLLLLDDLHAGAARRRARRADDDPAAALADRQGARQPPLPRRHRLRVGADRRREGRRRWRAPPTRAGLRVRLRAPAEGLPRHRRDAGAGRRKQTQPLLARSATLNGDITPEYLGVGYIIGPRIAGVLVAGGVLAWLALIPLLASLVPPDAHRRAAGEARLPDDIAIAGGNGGWDPATHTFANTAAADLLRLRAPDRRRRGRRRRLHHAAQDAARRSSRRSRRASPSLRHGARRRRHACAHRARPADHGRAASARVGLVLDHGGAAVRARRRRSAASSLLGVLIVVFGFFFVTVASRIVGIIGSSSNPISGMTIATLMATCLVFVGLGWTGDVYQPMALCVGGMVCIAAANAGATSQDLKTGFLVGATPRAQQIGLAHRRASTAAIVVGLTMQVLDSRRRAVAPGITTRSAPSKYPGAAGRR